MFYHILKAMLSMCTCDELKLLIIIHFSFIIEENRKISLVLTQLLGLGIYPIVQKNTKKEFKDSIKEAQQHPNRCLFKLGQIVPVF